MSIVVYTKAVNILLVTYLTFICCACTWDKATIDPKNIDQYEWSKERVLANLGSYEIDYLDKDNIIFNIKYQPMDVKFYDTISTNFYFDGLYKVYFPQSQRSYYFRHGFQHILPDGRIEFIHVHWIKETPVESGYVLIQSVEVPFIQHGNKSIATVGDSKTWWFHGQALRKKWNDLNPNLLFVGYRTDIYGYGHEGEGNNTSEEVINRIHRIKRADIYTLMIGTNDRRVNLTAEQSYQNIEKIVEKLLNKNASAQVYVLTILPRVPRSEGDNNEQINQQINQLIQTNLLKKFTSNVHVIDTYTYFKNLEHWERLTIDGLHPNDEGYNKLVSFLDSQIR